MLIIFLVGIIIGFVVAAPVGPVGLLCVRKTLEYGLTGALAVGLGTALADALYASIAAFGLAAISEYLLAHIVYCKILGAILLLALAIKEYTSKAQVVESVQISQKSLLQLIITTFVLTCFNPIAIMSFIGIFAMLSDRLLNISNPIVMIVGVFIGSILWYLFLGKIIHHTQHLLPDRFIFSIRKISAIIFALFASFSILSLLF
jgi:putative LysE/RhtB family amino acid efflux pump